MAKIGARTYELVEVKSLEDGAMRLRFESPLIVGDAAGKTGVTVYLDPHEANAVVNWQEHMPVTS